MNVFVLAVQAFTSAALAAAAAVVFVLVLGFCVLVVVVGVGVIVVLEIRLCNGFLPRFLRRVLHACYYTRCLCALT